MEKIDPEISVIDRILRELKIIRNIFKCQVEKIDSTDDPIQALDSEGKPTAGYYVASMDVFSGAKLLDLHEFKKHVTERFESSRRLDLLNLQLQKIKKEAVAALQFYDDHIIGPALQYQETVKKTNLNKRIELYEHHSALITIDQSLTYGYLYLGTSRGNWKFYKAYVKAYPIKYFADNGLFIHYSSEIVAFLENYLKGKKDKDYKPRIILPFHKHLRINPEYPKHEDRQQALATFLQKEFSGKGPKEIAFMIRALKKRKTSQGMFSVITYTDRKYLYQAIIVLFGKIGTNSGIDKYMEVQLPDKKLQENPKYKFDFECIQHKIEPTINKLETGC